MNQLIVRASEAEREQAAEMLRAGYAEGRLTRAELDERIVAAYAATTLGDLADLTRDLPGSGPAQATGPGAAMAIDRCLLYCLLFAFPPAGIAYWILTARRHRAAS